MSRRKPLYEGKAKILYEGPEPGTLIQYFKDDATAFNNQKKGTIRSKGVLNSRISAYIMERLNDIGVPTHYIRSLNMREQLVREVEIIPLEVIIRNIAAGSICKRLGLKDGEPMPKPLIEFCYKDDALGDPLVGEDHVLVFGWADVIELEEIKMQALRINDFLSGLFAGINIRLVDFKVEFGRAVEDGQYRILLADEISPDSCRLWDIDTGDVMDKDRFRKDMGKVEEAYQEVARRLGVLPSDQEMEAHEGTIVDIESRKGGSK
ncbi:MAG: phosphoribosylaminoimidazolesuccinocarboxamide synthase [Alphaproteobacteria bacterium]|nr:phosphoribosylaminoimidazolesuccinocarboxamide synthase [Alphaproteobacteria bacterium]